MFHGVPGIGGEVHQHLFDLAPVGDQHEIFFGQCSSQLDVFPDDPGQERLELPDAIVDIECPRLHLLLAAEGEETLGQGCRPLRRPQDLVDIVPVGAVLANPHLQEIGVADDRRQDVVEIMGYTSGEDAHRLDFLSLAQLRLEFFPFGDILEGAVDPVDIAGAVMVGLGIGGNPDLNPVFPPHQDLPLGEMTAAAEFVQLGTPVPGLRIEVRDGGCHHFRHRRVIEHRHHGRVDLDKSASDIG